MDSNGSFLCVWYKKNAEHTARPKMNAVIRSMHSRIVDTDIGECDRVDERCGRWLATIVGVFVVEVEDILERGGRCCCTVVVAVAWVELLLLSVLVNFGSGCGNYPFILFLQQTSASTSRR